MVFDILYMAMSRCLALCLAPVRFSYFCTRAWTAVLNYVDPKNIADPWMRFNTAGRFLDDNCCCMDADEMWQSL